MRETLERDHCGVWICELGLKTSGLAFKFGVSTNASPNMGNRKGLQKTDMCICVCICLKASGSASFQIAGPCHRGKPL